VLQQVFHRRELPTKSRPKECSHAHIISLGDIRSVLHKVHHHLEIALRTCKRQGCPSVIVSPIYVCAGFHKLLDPLQFAKGYVVTELVAHLCCRQLWIRIK
jgi:hypothetical protein